MENFLTKAVKNNEKVFSKSLSIFDSPMLESSDNNYYFDFEGTILKEKFLIEKVRLKKKLNNEFLTSKCSFDSMDRFTNILVNVSDLVYTKVKWYITEFSFNSILNPQTGNFTGIAYVYNIKDPEKKLYAMPINLSIIDALRNVVKNEDSVYNYKNLWSPNLIVDLKEE